MDIYTSQAFMNYHTDCYTHRFIVEQDYLNAEEAKEEACKAVEEAWWDVEETLW